MAWLFFAWVFPFWVLLLWVFLLWVFLVWVFLVWPVFDWPVLDWPVLDWPVLDWPFDDPGCFRPCEARAADEPDATRSRPLLAVRPDPRALERFDFDPPAADDRDLAFPDERDEDERDLDFDLAVAMSDGRRDGWERRAQRRRDASGVLA